LAILDNYYEEDTVWIVDDTDDPKYPHNAFWHNEDANYYRNIGYNANGGRNNEEKKDVRDDANMIAGDVYVNMSDVKQQRGGIPTSDLHEWQNKKKHDRLHAHNTYCYSHMEERLSTIRYLRGNFIHSLVATMQLLSTGLLVALSLFALNTDPLSALAFTGIAWTALWFQGGLIDLFRNYLFYFVIICTDKFHPGNILQVQGQMAEPGCVLKITPLCTVIAVKRFHGMGREEEIDFIDINNYAFFVYPVMTAFRWKKPKRIGGKIPSTAIKTIPPNNTTTITGA
jgi:hypothetical protein